MFDSCIGCLCSVSVILLIALHSVDVADGGLSGVYVDNGDQTVMQHALTDDDTEEVEREILELLGLPDRPRKRHLHPSLRYNTFQLNIVSTASEKRHAITKVICNEEKY